ncbi:MULTISPECIES: phosphotransferase [Micromonospora]|uniref:phosphotransferase n=1 Tax=Micromonospora TaxID=1873 RepID=UPI000C8894D3|nr:phosphotransferase [Verrucosispora sp. ts21]PMR59291.1 aminoglycoside phosphotransferase [Verrucosispora sp. ts21]
MTDDEGGNVDDSAPGEGWSGLAAWAGVKLLRPLPGGHRNVVMLAERAGVPLVVRRSIRSRAALDWELDLLEHLRDRGVAAPELVPTDDGRRHVDGMLVSEFVPGRHPAGPADWRRVVDQLAVLHTATTGWPQRPGFAASGMLLDAGRGGDVRLDAMPASVARLVRSAWLPVQQGPRCVVHGDVGPTNVLVDGARVTLLDWDEARVDVPWFDYALLPDEVTTPWPGDRAQLRAAGLAWETATCWRAEPVYARRRLAELHRHRRHSGA